MIRFTSSADSVGKNVASMAGFLGYWFGRTSLTMAINNHWEKNMNGETFSFSIIDIHGEYLYSLYNIVDLISVLETLK